MGIVKNLSAQFLLHINFQMTEMILLKLISIIGLTVYLKEIKKQNKKMKN